MFSGVTRAENRPNDRGRERDLAEEQIDKKVEGGGTVLNADNIRVVYSPFSLAGGTFTACHKQLVPSLVVGRLQSRARWGNTNRTQATPSA
jgi:hypothetical protein